MPIDRRTLLATSLSLPAVARAQALPGYRLGVLTDLSGAYRDNSGPTTVVAARLAVEDFKPASHGFNVEVLSADHQQKPDVGGAIARQWFDRDGVDAIADVNNTAIALAVRTQALEKDKALLISGAASGELTGKSCSDVSVHWAPDTYGDSHSTGKALLKEGAKSWWLLVPDYVFGHNLQADTEAVVKAGGGTVAGVTRYPFPGTTDFSGFLLQAANSTADVIAFCATGGDMENGVKQAHEFGLDRRGKRVAAMFGFITEMKALGLETAQGLYMTEPFYWDLNERTRAFTRRLLAKAGDNYPSSLHAAAYSAVTHWMKAVASVGAEKGRSGRAAIAAMKGMATDDDCFGAASVRADGRFLADTHLFRVKKPGESKAPWDIYAPVSVTPGAEAFRPLAESACPLVRT